MDMDSQPAHSNAATSLDAIETTAHAFPLQYRDALIARCPKQYQSVLEAYRLLDAEDGKRRFSRLTECRNRAFFTVHDETGEVRVTSSSCKLRWCPLCASAKRQFLRKEIAQWMTSQPEVRFMTLTSKHTAQPLQEQLDGLYSAFRLLRQSPAFKRYVTGGIWFLQTHVSASDGFWHNHLHCIITGRYIPQNLLRDMWLSKTQTSHIVDIRQVKDIQESADYVARYASSPSNPAKLPPQSLLDLMRACHGRRIVGKWGVASAVRLTPTLPDDAAHYKSVGSFRDLMQMAANDDTASHIILAWRNGTPVPERIRHLLFFDTERKFKEFRRKVIDPHFEFS